MRFSPHLTFDGQCRAAFEFYERVLGGKIVTMLCYGASPLAERVPPQWQDKIVHANLTVEDAELVGADAFPKQYEKPQGFYVLLEVANPLRAEQIFHALAHNGTVRLPIQKTFWSPAFGMLVDQFGIPWEISCHPPVDAGNAESGDKI